MTNETRELGAGDRVVLTTGHVYDVLSAWTGIPVERLQPAGLSGTDFARLKQTLEGHIFGQPGAVAAAVSGLQRRFLLPERAGVRRPIWTALFIGPSGVGKTQLARELATHFFGDGQKHLVRVDLSELSQEHTVSRLVGAPPGYVGHGGGGELTNALRKCPSGVVLLDEVEKAHPAILTTVILPMIGEGLVHDMNDGRTLDVTNVLVIMTANAHAMRAWHHAHRLNRHDSDPDDVDEHRVLDAVHNHFPREVLGRIDDIVVFGPLSLEAARAVWRREVTALEERLTTRGQPWRVAIEPDAEAVFQKEMAASTHLEGARAIVRFFDRAVVDRCLEFVGRSGRAGGTIRVGIASHDAIRCWINEDSEPAPIA